MSTQRARLFPLRRWCLFAGWILSVWGVTGLNGAGIPSRPPNIIFILADDLGYGDLGCYGQQRIRTPALDRLAREGMRFTQCYAGSTVCAPSRCCLMTGKDTGHARIRGNARVPLAPGDVTVARVLHDAGYRTGLVGKWGLGEAGSTGVPTRQGFDEFFGYLSQVHAHNSYPSFLWRGEEQVRLRNVVPNETRDGAGVSTNRVEYSNDLFANEALDFVERHRAQPFFLYLAFTIPHANNEAGRRGMEVPSDAPYLEEPWPPTERHKAAMITRMDRAIDRLLTKLEELGLDRRTVVFFSSDNGPHREGGVVPEFFASSGGLRGIKRDLYEGGIRVPMIVRWPGRVRAGAVSDFPWAFWDVLPTLADLARAKPPPGLDGVSILPTLLGHGQKPHPFFYWEFHEGGSQQAVRMGNWKAIRVRAGAPPELYHLKRDPEEKHNVASRERRVIARIEDYLRTARTESAEWPLKLAK